MDFALITEGITDQFVLDRLIRFYLQDKNLLIQELQPKPTHPEDAGWTKVLSYLESDDFREFLESNSTTKIVIQIDTDVSHNYGVSPQHCAAKPSDEAALYALRDEVIKILIEKIGKETYQNHQHRIYFAVCIHSLECWLLFFYATDNKSHKKKIASCLDTLNDYLNTSHSFTIDENKKTKNHYENIFLKNKKTNRFENNGRNYTARIDMRYFFESLKG